MVLLYTLDQVWDPDHAECQPTGKICRDTRAASHTLYVSRLCELYLLFRTLTEPLHSPPMEMTQIDPDIVPLHAATHRAGGSRSSRVTGEGKKVEQMWRLEKYPEKSARPMPSECIQ